MKKSIGHISIDAGLCWIGDPCYVLPNGATDNPGSDWSAFCDATTRPTTQPAIFDLQITPMGDGSYPVTAEIRNGRVMSVTVNFGEDT